VFRKAKGVAIKCGKVSNLTVIDVDDPEKFNKFYNIDKLIQEAGYVVRSRTPGRYHFGFAYAEELESIDLVREAGFEIKSDNRIINFCSTIPGEKYTIESFNGFRPMPEDLKQKIKELIASKKERPTLSATKYPERHAKNPEELAKRILDILEPYYIRGYRHHFVLCTSGIFRIAGIPKSVATDTLLAFCKNMGDEELSDRKRTIQGTYSKPKEEPIAKFRYLKEGLGVSDEHIGQIRNLIKRDDAKNQEQTEERVPVAKENSKLTRRAKTQLLVFPIR
jgi:Bifunctional DNA primase/polymerase, N-terminal.